VWTNGGRPDATQGLLSGRERQGPGVAAVANDFVRLCGATDTAHCPFSAGSPEATRAKLDQLLDRLRRGPITITIGSLGSVRLTYGQFLGSTDGLLHTVQPGPGPGAFGWGGIGRIWQDLWEARDAPVPAEPPVPPTSSYFGQEPSLAIICGEAPQPPADRYAALAAEQQRIHGPFGAAIVWQDASCAGWPVQAADPYRGPWNTGTTPALVMGATNDPATPFENSRKMVEELGAGARLLTVDGYGHVVFNNPSACAQAAVTAYLVDGTLPAEGTVCQQDKAPFADPVSP
jgi:pimeloyl-ACP methyl ester carboxylesterase